jgi:hypothetical protein
MNQSNSIKIVDMASIPFFEKEVYPGIRTNSHSKKNTEG